MARRAHRGQPGTVRVVVMNHVSLDGVMQGPGRSGEDDREGFTNSGWATPRSDEVIGQALSERMATSAGLLFGRRTYEDLLRHWTSVPNTPFAEPLNAATKYVATSAPRRATCVAELDRAACLLS